MNDKIDYKSLGFPSEDTYRFPNFVNVEVYRGSCSCRCVHCPLGSTEPGKRKERFGKKGMDLGLYEKIVKEMKDYPHSTLRIHSVGEPMHWKDLPAASRITKNNDVRSYIFTCAVTKDRSMLDTLCENISVVEVSVNGITPKDYMERKGIDAFGVVKENIEYMHNLREKGLPVRLIASRVQSIDRDADQAFIDYWRMTGLVDDAFVRSYHSYNDLMPELAMEGKGVVHEPCLVHWARFNISVDGYSALCFNELFKEQLDPSLILGDINKQSVVDIWHGPELTALRKAELSGDYSELPFGQALPCKECYSSQPLFGEGETCEKQIEKMEGGK